MPRRHRSARDRKSPPIQRGLPGLAPEWAHLDGFTVRQVLNQKSYVCPGCNGEIPPGIPHLVVAEEYDPDQRRHWHTPCWRQELRASG